MQLDDAALAAMNFGELTELIKHAEALRVEQAQKMRAEIDEKARLLGLEVHDNGKPARRKRTAPTAQDPEA